MRYFRCKCGRRESWSSMGVPRCSWCEHCQSNLAEGPGGHRERVEHDLSAVQTLATDQGDATITCCRYCHLTRSEIEERAT